MELMLPFGLFFDTEDEARRDKALTRLGEPQQRAEPMLRCAACGEPVTPASAQIERGGAHAHRFANPHGIEFEIGCFAEAPGCVARGGGTEEHT